MQYFIETNEKIPDILIFLFTKLGVTSGMLVCAKLSGLQPQAPPTVFACLRFTLLETVLKSIFKITFRPLLFFSQLPFLKQF